MHERKYIFLLILFLCVCGTVKPQKGKQSKQTSSVELTSEDQRKFDYYFYAAANAKVTGKFDAAYDYIKYCYQIDSTNANVLYELGDYYHTIDKPSKSMDYYRKAIAYDPDNLYYNLAYAALCFELKQYTDAIDQYQKLIKKDPENSELYLYLSEANRLAGDLPKAIEALDKLEQLIGLNDKVSLQKYQLYSQLNQENKAFLEIQKYIDKYPTELRYRILLGRLYMQADKKTEAYLTYSRAKAIDPEDPYLISSMAEYYEVIGNKEAAEKELQAALISPKMDITSKLDILGQYIGTLQQNRKDTHVANALFDTLMLQHPQEPQLNLMYGSLLMLQKNTDEARFQYQIYAEANPTSPVGWEQMLSTTFPDSIDLSIDICKKAISYNPQQAQFYFYLGMGNYIKENYNDALDALQKGVTLVDERNVRLLSDFYGQIGDLYQHTERQDSAFASYEQALKYNPANIGILNNYSYYLAVARKDLDRAEKMSAITIKAEPSNPTYLDTYGWVLFEQGAYSIAKVYIEKSINYSEEQKEELSSEVLEHYGDVLFKTGETDKALEYWLKAKEKEKESDKSPTLDKKIETKTYISKE